MDIWSKEKRSECMSKIHSKNTKPELALRKALFAKGFRFRVNYAKLPGKPDIVLPKYRTAIFVNGCFWHHHEGCKYANIPKSNTKFWIDKINSNVARDGINKQKLSDLGWNVITIWECEIRHTHNITPLINKVSASIISNIPHIVKLYELQNDKISLVAEDIVEYNKTPKL